MRLVLEDVERRRAESWEQVQQHLVELQGVPAEILAGARDHARPETKVLQDLAGARDHTRLGQQAVGKGALLDILRERSGHWHW